MVITILEARVDATRWQDLQDAYRRRAAPLTAGIRESFLAQSISEQNLWRIMTVWESREALDRMRQSGGTPVGVLIFRDAGAEPTLSLFSVHANPNISAHT